MIDPFHLEAYGEKAINYNRDIEVFPVVKRIIEKITGEESEYQSPTDMGVNRVGFCITDDEACQEASCQEIIRRFLIAAVDFKKGKIESDSLDRAELLMKEVGKAVGDRVVVQKARDYAEFKRELCDKIRECSSMAMEMPDGHVITGRSSRRMVAAAAVVLNSIKYLAEMPDELLLIEPKVLETTQHLKTDVLGYDRSSLNCEEILMALTVSGVTDEKARLAASKLSLLHGCRAHCTAILSDRDEQTLSSLGIDVTCDPEYVTTNLYSN